MFMYVSVHLCEHTCVHRGERSEVSTRCHPFRLLPILFYLDSLSLACNLPIQLDCLASEPWTCLSLLLLLWDYKSVPLCLAF